MFSRLLKTCVSNRITKLSLSQPNKSSIVLSKVKLSVSLLRKIRRRSRKCVDKNVRSQVFIWNLFRFVCTFIEWIERCGHIDTNPIYNNQNIMRNQTPQQQHNTSIPKGSINNFFKRISYCLMNKTRIKQLKCGDTIVIIIKWAMLREGAINQQ